MLSSMWRYCCGHVVGTLASSRTATRMVSCCLQKDSCQRPVFLRHLAVVACSQITSWTMCCSGSPWASNSFARRAASLASVQPGSFSANRTGDLFPLGRSSRVPSNYCGLCDLIGSCGVTASRGDAGRSLLGSSCYVQIWVCICSTSIYSLSSCTVSLWGFAFCAI